MGLRGQYADQEAVKLNVRVHWALSPHLVGGTRWHAWITILTGNWACGGRSRTGAPARWRACEVDTLLRPLVRTPDENDRFILYRIRRSGPKGGRQGRLIAHTSGDLTQRPDGVGWRHAHEHQIRICDGREGTDGARCVDQHIATRENERIDQDIDCIGDG
jgi:hypothetical protein